MLLTLVDNGLGYLAYCVIICQKYDMFIISCNH